MLSMVKRHKHIGSTQRAASVLLKAFSHTAGVYTVGQVTSKPVYFQIEVSKASFLLLYFVCRLAAKSGKIKHLKSFDKVETWLTY